MEIETHPVEKKKLSPEDILPPTPGGGALGRSPFEEIAEPHPFLERLDGLELRSATAPGRPGARNLRFASEPRAPLRRGDPPAERSRRRATAAPARLPRRRPSTTPPLGEIELPEPQGWLDRLIGEDERCRLAALGHLVEGEVAFDRYGFSPETARRAFPLFHALYRFYFRVRSQGHNHIPVEGPAVLAANHGGLLPFDAAMGVVDILLHTNPTRLARAIVDRWAGSLPWVNIFFARVGQVIDTRKNFADLLGDEQLVMVFPEGIDGIRKPITQRHWLQRFRVGFVEQALRSRAPIVPMAFIGSEDQAPILYDVKPLARWLGLPVAPITPTFPWLGPMGLLPYPVSYRIVYGEPLYFHERFGPEGAEDPRLVRYLANQVRRRVQLLVDRNR